MLWVTIPEYVCGKPKKWRKLCGKLHGMRYLNSYSSGNFSFFSWNEQQQLKFILRFWSRVWRVRKWEVAYRLRQRILWVFHRYDAHNYDRIYIICSLEVMLQIDSSRWRTLIKTDFIVSVHCEGHSVEPFIRTLINK